MPGLASPDVPAYVSYLIVLVVGAAVARATVSERLAPHPDHWAFLGSWSLFFAYWAVPVVLFWFLDYTNAIQDTSVFAALLVAFGYYQIFAGSVQGVTVAPQAATLWKPFQGWVDRVADRIATRQKRYRDRFTEWLRSTVTKDPEALQRLEQVAMKRSAKPEDLRKDVAAARAFEDKAVIASRTFDVLWRDLRTSAPDDYGYAIYTHGLVSRGRRWWALDRGRAKVISSLVLICIVIAIIAGWRLRADRDAQGFLESAFQQYAHWRLLKSNGTDRDRWRAREYLSEQLSASLDGPVLLPTEATANVARTTANVTKARESVDTAVAPEDKARATKELMDAQQRLDRAFAAESQARRIQALLSPLLAELRFAEVSRRNADDILRLLVDHHAPTLNRFYVADLIEDLRTPNEVTRLNIHRTLLELRKADYPKTSIEKALEQWQPQKNETPADVDRFVRLWRDWWRTADVKAA